MKEQELNLADSEDIDLLYKELEEATQKSFIDDGRSAPFSLTTTLLSNDPDKNRKVIQGLLEELRSADAFAISVAFITRSGLQLFKETFQELARRNVRGRILTTDYLCFTEPEALRDIRDHMKNIEVRMYKTFDDRRAGFHTKGYLIRQGRIHKFVIGSSNMTAPALSTSKEWNTKLVTTGKGQFGKAVLEEFESLWQKATPLEDYLSTYESIYGRQKERERKERAVVPAERPALRPNAMQIQFCQNLKKLFDKGATKGLLISSTGTGKTYASAFGLRQLPPGRVLFLAHRKQLLVQALLSYRNVMDEHKTYALLSGEKTAPRGACPATVYENGKHYDFLFSTCEMMGKKEVLNAFQKKEFDYIVIDEVHRAGSMTYKRILDHFQPRFLLGMTATPERSDDETFLYNLFDHNVLFEIRLQDALDYDLLCPFHYYGITDVHEIDDKDYKLGDFNRLLSDDRIDWVLRQSEYYGYSGDRLRGLIFTSTVEDGRLLAQKLCEKGRKALFLSGANSVEERNDAICRLEETDRSKECLDFIVTCDIFNEGVDIPEVNQIILLRPTKSPIIFLQQLGRGLRKWQGKDFLVVLDFIGNYDSNYMIPKAFAPSGDKEEARMVVSTGYLPGCSTIEFDEIARQRIFSSLSHTNFDTLSNFKVEYQHLKNKLNRVPTLVDFLLYSDFDPVRIFREQKSRSYPEFLSRIGAIPAPDPTALSYLAVLTKAIGEGLRREDALFLRDLIRNEGEWHGTTVANETSLLSLLRNRFFAGSDGSFPLVKDLGSLDDGFRELLKTPSFRQGVDDVVEFSLLRNERLYSERYRGTGFTLFERYSRDDVSILFDLPKSHASTLYGYQYLKEAKAFPIFVNYVKGKDIAERTRYEDVFEDTRTLSWNSRHGEKEESKNMQALIHHRENGVRVFLFVRKSTKEKGEGKLHYFLGEMKVLNHNPFRRNGHDYVHFTFELMDEVRQDIFDYLKADISEGETE